MFFLVTLFRLSYRNSAGCIYLRFDSTEAAVKAQRAMHMRWFAGRSISALFMVNVFSTLTLVSVCPFWLSKLFSTHKAPVKVVKMSSIKFLSSLSWCLKNFFPQTHLGVLPPWVGRAGFCQSKLFRWNYLPFYILIPRIL